ncbi:MAG: outer membrane protein transport protein [Myxococcales bacterium]|nr:outer membrane protein transport protein [Myxococcales bacterium]
MRWTRVLFSIGCVVACLLASRQAHAAGFYLPGRGVSSMARGGTGIAGADSLQAMWYNPANLAAFKGVNLLIDAGVIFSGSDFQRSDRTRPDGTTEKFSLVQNEAPPLPDPSLMFAYGWKDPNITVALGIYAPYALSLKFPDTGPQRYGIVDMSGSLFVVSQASIAWAPHPRFRLGLSIQNVTVTVRLMTAASAYLGIFGEAESPDLDLYTEGRLNSYFNISGNLGAWGRAVDLPGFKLDLAASMQAPVRVQGEGTMRVRLPTHPLFDPTTVEGDQVSAGFWLPFIIRGAARASFWGDRADIEVAFVYETWSMHDVISFSPTGSGIVLRNVPTIGDYVVPPINIPRNWKDAFSVRVGGKVEVVKGWFQILYGYIFEASAIPDDMFSVLIMDSDKHVFSLGARVTVKNMTFDLGYGLYWMPERRITNSKYTQINPLNPEGASVIGNGVYNATVHILGLSWQGQF